jgi:glutathione synthase/RimK-type ligase-like ATP-grasp enzyme
MKASEILNRACDCSAVDLTRLTRDLESALQSQSTLEGREHLFSELPVFLDPAHAAQMQELISAFEAVTRLAKYRELALREAPEIARIDHGAGGAFMGFDFHITPNGPKLIEVNTNAGGAFLNIAARNAQRACNPAAAEYLAALPDATQLEQDVVAMFEREWGLMRARTLRTVAIVDENPRAQFLYPEFELARKLFESRGIQAFIADPAELELTDNCVRLRGATIDLVYNRLTDFYFEAPANHVLRLAYERGSTVVTPNPRAHALYANKRNLALLTDAAVLEEIGVTAAISDILRNRIPSTRAVLGVADDWWRARKGWFFKPRSGFGGRGAYRGEKLTRRVMAEVVRGEYIAQEFTPPSERWRSAHAGEEALKMDIRCYAYAGRIQLMAARLYQGQTTNFRTAGGGFAPVYVVAEGCS